MPSIGCPKCGLNNASAAVICIHCGQPLCDLTDEQLLSVADSLASFNDEARRAVIEQLRQRALPVKCPACGFTNTARDPKCVRCGYNFDARVMQASEHSERPLNAGEVIQVAEEYRRFIVVAVVFLLSAVAILANQWAVMWRWMAMAQPTGNGGGSVLLLIGTALALFVAVEAYRLAAAMQPSSSLGAVGWAIGCSTGFFIPFVNLICLVALNRRAAEFFRGHALQVGALGPTRDSIKRLAASMASDTNAGAHGETPLTAAEQEQIARQREVESLRSNAAEADRTRTTIGEHVVAFNGHRWVCERCEDVRRKPGDFVGVDCVDVSER